MEEEGFDTESEAWPLPLKDKRLPWFYSLPLPFGAFYSPASVCLLKGWKPTARRPLP